MGSAIERRNLLRSQLGRYLTVYNDYNGKTLGYLGNVSPDGVLLISRWPLLVGEEYRLRVFTGESWQPLTAYCRWSLGDVSGDSYDSGLQLDEWDGVLEQLMDILKDCFTFDGPAFGQ